MRARTSVLPCVSLVALLAAPVASRANTIETSQSGISQIRVAGTLVQEARDGQVDGRVSVFAIEGSLATPEARTAARASAEELAVNAKIDDKSNFSRTEWTEVLSAATYVLEVPSAFAQRAVFDFFLPPSFLEVTSNAELRQNALEVIVFADLRACFTATCGANERRFFFQDILEASYESYSHTPQVSGDASLDLDPFLDPTVTDDVGGFLRTVNVSFPAFSGRIDLGILPADETLRIEYQLQARASGLGAFNVGIAAINDPFLLEGDPVQRFAPLTLTLTPVPEPGAAALVGVGLAALARRARGRGRPL